MDNNTIKLKLFGAINEKKGDRSLLFYFNSKLLVRKLGATCGTCMTNEELTEVLKAYLNFNQPYDARA